ncbi:MAG: hypothetical protein AAF806_05965 [Bacteroidota bacterium]
MKYYESTDFFLRVVVTDLVHKEFENIKFKLIPMFHVGEQSYYDSVLELINSCDKLLYEGIRIKKLSITKQFGRYDKVAKRLELVSQYEYFKNPKNQILIPRIHADLDLKKSNREWKKLRFSEKWRYRLLDPVNYAIETFSITRYKLAKAFMTRAEEVRLAYGPLEDEEGTLENLIMNTRENILISHINQILEDKHKNEALCIGIMYGAAHMKRIGDYLTHQKDFSIREANFLVVFRI